MVRKVSLYLTLIVLIEALIMINAPVANSYNIGQSSESFEEVIISGDKDFDLVGRGINLLVGILSIKQIGSVSAEIAAFNRTYGATNYANASFSSSGVSWNCCTETNEGVICQDLAPGNAEACKANPLPTACENVAECKVGCCYDSEEGLCTTKAPRGKCEQDNGVWKDEENCLINECQKGCCILGSDVAFITRQSCNHISALNGYNPNFEDYTSEVDCILLKRVQTNGACVLAEGACEFGTEVECVEKQGTFYKDKLCSYEPLNNECEKQTSTSCVEGFDEVYWFDSCGNRENIYSSDKVDSWNEGEVLNKGDSCGVGKSNIDSIDCGNCNYFLGSRCGEGAAVYGELSCQSMNCIDEQGNQRKNGESWCVYDSFIGDGKDTAGSRHWKRMCIEGEIKVDACADYRGGICVEGEVEKEETGETFTVAGCVLNEAVNCIGYNSEENAPELCEENSQCMTKKIDIDDFKFDICVGKYSRGFDLTGQIGRDTSKQLCGMANQECIVVYEKKISGWKCILNCDCEEKVFAEQMNDLCISLGDCGSYINYLGEGSDNIKVEESPIISWQEYVDYKNPVEGQKAEPKTMKELLKNMNIPNIEEYPEQSIITTGISLISMTTGGVGVGISATIWAFGPGMAATSFGPGAPGALTPATGIQGVISPGVAAFGQALGAFGMAMIAGAILTKVFGLQGDAAMVMAVSSAIAGAYLGYMAFGADKVVFGCFDPLTCAIVIFILIVIAIVMKVLGIGDTKEVNVKFTCMQWEPPVGADNCERCGGDPLKPCSEYRCSSLGKACGLINKNEENPKCVAIEKNDGRAPDISSNEIAIGYDFFRESEDRVEIRDITDECIPEFTPVLFSLETDKYSQCKFSYQRKDSFEEMSEFFVEGTSYEKNHTTALMVPSLSSLMVYNITGNLIEQFGNMNMFVRCQDSYGNINKKEYNVNFCIKTGEDITAPAILATDPINTATLKYNLTEIPLTIYTNEPAECKYDRLDNLYGDMTNEMECETDLLDYENYGWPCRSILTNLGGDNAFYIRCKDQPWLESNGSRNTNNQGYKYELFSSTSDLQITSVSPSGIIAEGFEPITVELEVKTSGGMNNGISTCYYSFDGDSFLRFLDTYSNSHKQVFDQMVSGDYNIRIKCVDDAYNEDNDETIFRLNLDEVAPIVVRVYEENGLKLITNEEAECYYSNKLCSFNLENATSITSGFSTEHLIDSVSEEEYYVKCADTWGNVNTGCAIVVKEGLIL